MTYSVYIDYPYDDYTYLPGEKKGDDVVSRKTGARVKFVCNPIAKISKGDVYEVFLDSPEDATSFILSCEYKLISEDAIKRYRQKKAHQYASLEIQYPSKTNKKGHF